ncbi:Coenzyme F390 synthetase [Candidatus Terasakiella magnetica]|uniref:Coenzyme F390 synthetase n=1 Tax=Candidatus Terasakiella magnetica TaxID=1867952 RepID=A0A1C3REC1_9PROT|nr:AMP-binding protein [Candidatus Terasakiella magnetica]SCA55578.1 Coenzyme F390 synthetase [Candidatus Terasakiella magnetica]
MSDQQYFDPLETRGQAQREEEQLSQLASQLAHAKSNAAYFSDLLKEIDPVKVDRDLLASIPVTRKSDLVTQQREVPPFGGMSVSANGLMGRLFQSPGPIYDPEGREADYWRTSRAFHAAGFRSGDVVLNTLSYHMTPGGFILDGGAHALGCSVIPAGPGNTEQQLEIIRDLKPNGYCGTPSFLRILLEKADDAGIETSCFEKALVTGEALPPSVRDWFVERGINVGQVYATADLGSIAYESSAKEGLIVDEGVLVEIVRPGTNDPLPEGEVGEVVVTNLNSQAYPLIRFGTGDLSAVLEGASPCGRNNMRIKGWMGRADQTTKVKGMFVHPAQVNQVVKQFDQIEKGRLVVSNDDNRDAMTLQCEVSAGSDDLAKAIGESVQTICKLRGFIEFVEPGTLANDGKVIDDIRTYD